MTLTIKHKQKKKKKAFSGYYNIAESCIITT